MNFVINFLLLLATGKIVRLQLKSKRIMAGAFVGAVYSVMMFFPNVSPLYSAVSKFAVSMVLVASAFKIKRIKTFMKTVTVFYGVSFVFGAVCIGIFYLTGAGKGTMISNGVFYFTLPWRVLMISSFVSYCLIRFMWRTQKANKLRTYKKVEISLLGKTVHLSGLVDTGNMLCDPLSQTPVIIAQFEKLRPLLPDKFQRAYVGSSPEGLMLADTGEEMESRLRLIPFSSLGSSKGLLIGFKPDKITIDKRQIGDIIIGISPESLSPDDEYGALINPEILTL